MSRIRGKNTGPEIAMRSMLHKFGFRFRIHGKKLPGNPDIVLSKYKTVIFVHGCFWHRHANCKYCYTPKSRNEFWKNKFQRTVQRDDRVMKAISETGWLPLVVWECEIIGNTANTLRKVKNILQKRFLRIRGGV